MPCATWAASRTKRSPSIPPPATSTKPRTPAAAPGSIVSSPNTPGQLADGGELSHDESDATSTSPTSAAATRTARRSTSNGCRSRHPTTRRRSPATSSGRRAARRARRRSRGSKALVRQRRKIYIVSTSGGIGQGQIWEYDPAAETIGCCSSRRAPTVLNAPDNITVSPRGGLVLCEDGSGEEFMHGLTVDGEIFPFAQEQRGPQRRTQRHHRRLPRIRVGRRLLQPRRSAND